jgi:hypothetical protein
VVILPLGTSRFSFFGVYLAQLHPKLAFAVYIDDSTQA